MRYLLLILILFATSADARMMLPIVGGGAEEAAGGDCASGTYEIGYNGDHSSGADYTCYESGTASEQGTTQDASVSASYVEYSDVNDYLKWTITGDISAGIDDQGSIFFSFNQTTDTDVNTNNIFELYYTSSSNLIRCTLIEADDSITCWHWAQGSTGDSVATTDVSFQTDTRCGLSWDVSGTDLALDCVTSGSVAWTSNGGSPDIEDNSATLASFSSDVDTLVIGEDISGQSVTDTMRVWDVFVTTGYKGTDPGTL